MKKFKRVAYFPVKVKFKLSPWFSAKETPIRKGVYEVNEHDLGCKWFAYWNGKGFGYRCYSHRSDEVAIEKAFYSRNDETSCPPLTGWRGIVK